MSRLPGARSGADRGPSGLSGPPRGRLAVRVATGCELAGYLLLVVAGFLLAVPAGLAVLGLVLVWVGREAG